MTETQAPGTDSWDGFIDNFLKAEHVMTWPCKAFCAFVSSSLSRDDKPQLICDLQYDGQKFKWQANITNMKKLRELGVENPKALQNCHIVFEKVRVQNPQTGKTVDSLEVVKLE